MKNEKLPELPREFKPASENPTKVLHNLFQEVTKFKLECNNCKEKIYSGRIIEEQIDPWIQHTLFKKTPHPLFQLETWEDIFYIVCPKCQEPSLMKGCDI